MEFMADHQDQNGTAVAGETGAGSADAEQDEELDELLSSALSDFDKPLPSKAVDNASCSDTSSQSETVDAKWSEEFVRQAAVQFEQNMKALLSQSGNPSDTPTPDQLGANFQKIAEAAARAVTEEGGASDDEFSSAISQTLKNLSEGAENLQSQFSEEDIANIFSGLGVGEESDGEDNIPLMEQFMHLLLSKDVLYAPIKDVLDKYPAWLEENQTKLEPSEFERFSKQKTVMDQVCAELLKESDSDSQEVKKRRFDMVVGLLQKMQDCGLPPKDLVGDLGPMVAFDEHGHPRMPMPGFGLGADPSERSSM